MKCVVLDLHEEAIVVEVELRPCPDPSQQRGLTGGVDSSQLTPRPNSYN